MRTTLLIIFVLALSMAIGISCSNDPPAPAKKVVIQPINPNGDSELALLMRAMFDEAALIKKQIAAGEEITVKLDYEKLLTADATEPEKAASDAYQAYGKLHIQLMQSLQRADNTQVRQLYKNAVDNCMNCHELLCPGPIVRIEKLR